MAFFVVEEIKIQQQSTYKEKTFRNLKSNARQQFPSLA